MRPEALLAKVSLEADISLQNLRRHYEDLSQLRERDEHSTKLLAEICFLIAREHDRSGNIPAAERFARESIALYEQIDTESFETAAPILSEHLPELMHEGVVRFRLLGER